MINSRNLIYTNILDLTKRSPTRGDLQRIETILQHHLTNFQKNKNMEILEMASRKGLIKWHELKGLRIYGWITC